MGSHGKAACLTNPLFPIPYTHTPPPSLVCVSVCVHVVWYLPWL